MHDTPEEQLHYERSVTYPAMGRSFCYITCPFCHEQCKAYIWSLNGGGKRCPKCRAMHTAYGMTIRDRKAIKVPTVTTEQAQAILDKDDLSEEDLDTLALAAADISHESTCPRKVFSAAECQCIRSRILETLNEHNQGT